jgi:hypothetical protein
MVKLTVTVKAIDAALVSNLQTRGDVLDHPEIDAAPEVEPGLRRCALPVVKAVASRQKRLDPPAALIAEEVVGNLPNPYRNVMPKRKAT